MYITITKQQMEATYMQSAGDFVAYLEKEDKDKHHDLVDPFFDQNNDRVPADTVTKEIDANTAKLKKREPKFYSITINPSKRELKAINNDPLLLRHYVREVMKDYAASFYRNQAVQVGQLKYYAKIEHERTYSGKDREIQENRPFKAKIAKLRNELRQVDRGELKENRLNIEREIQSLEKQTPHKLDGKPIVEGMKKPGHQMHVHIIMSRKDNTNRFSLSPGSSYRESEGPLNGKMVKRGFKRDQFFEAAEKTFDRMFSYDRSYTESYSARKTLSQDPLKYFARLAKLPTNERSVALKVLGKSGMPLPLPDIPKSKMDLVLKSIKRLRQGMDIARGSSTIEI
jgi:hypothetical protein